MEKEYTTQQGTVTAEEYQMKESLLQTKTFSRLLPGPGPS